MKAVDVSAILCSRKKRFFVFKIIQSRIGIVQFPNIFHDSVHIFFSFLELSERTMLGNRILVDFQFR